MFSKSEIIVIVSCGRIEKVCSKNNLPVRVILANYDAEDAEGVIITDKDGNAIGLSDLEVEYDSDWPANFQEEPNPGQRENSKQYLSWHREFHPIVLRSS